MKPSKQKKIENEIKRLLGIFRDIPLKEKNLIDGVLKRAAYMRIVLEEMELDLNTNGFVEMFSQSEKTEPYERERPVARLYNTINKNYQSIMKQLSDLLRNESPPAEPVEDEFDRFLNNRPE